MSKVGAKVAHHRAEHPAETSAGVGGSLGALVVWGLGLGGVEVPAAAAGGIILIVGWLAAYVTKRVNARRTAEAEGGS